MHNRLFILFLPLLAILGGISTVSVASAASKINRNFRQGDRAITRQNAEASLRFLASDALRGRFGGSVEGRIAAQYLVAELEQMGYIPVVQSFTGRKGESLQNILVAIPGRDTTKRVVVGAHYDHEGVKNGEVYNGADDNASGTVAVLELARAAKGARMRPERTVIFAFWDGEERGLQGSRYYAERIGDTTAVLYYLNFDSVGRNTDESRPGLFRYFYTEAHPEARRWLDESIKVNGLTGLEPDYRPWDRPTGGSDNASFAKRGIPIIWYHTDGHPDFHKPTDTADKINYSKLIGITRSAWYLIWRMAY